MLNCLADEQRAGGLFFAILDYGAIEELVIVEVDLKEGGAFVDVAGDEGFGERVFDVALESAAERTGSIAAVDQGFLEDPLLRLFSDGDGDGLLREVRIELLNEQLENLDQIGIRQGLEEDDLVDTVEELRVEGALDLVLHQVFDFLHDHGFAVAL